MDIERQKRLNEAQAALMSTHSDRRTAIRKETLDAIGKHLENIDRALQLLYARTVGISPGDPVIEAYKESYVKARCELQQDANHAVTMGVVSVGKKSERIVESGEDLG